MGCWATEAVPVSEGMRPMRRSRRLLLPQPLGASRTLMVWAWTEKVRPEPGESGSAKRSRGPRRRVRFFTSRTGGVAAEAVGSPVSQ